MIQTRPFPSPRRVLFVLAAAMTGCLFFLGEPARALESDWAETEGGRMRLVIDPEPRADGAVLGVLDIDLEPGWKTYWRDPGSAGIPPMLDLSGSRGIALEGFDYPPPVRVDDGYAVWAGYTAPVRFPLRLRRTAPGEARLEAQAFIGICEKICVPFQAEFTLDLPAEGTVSDRSRTMIAQARSLLPEAPGEDFRVENVRIDSTKGVLEITARLPAFRPSGASPELFVAGPAGSAFGQPDLIADEGGTVSWRVEVERLPAANGDLDPATIDAVITLGQRSMGQSLAATTSTPD